MASKQLERLAKKAEKEEKAEKNKLKLVQFEFGNFSMCASRSRSISQFSFVRTVSAIMFSALAVFRLHNSEM